MVLEWLDYKLDGDKWEDLCIEICRIIYKHDFFHKVPSRYKGDGGIEGFTKSDSGIVIQCYCPDDPNISVNDLYAAQRKKVTDDIKKIIDNHIILKGIGVDRISKWIFMVPDYKDRRILKHCKDKEKMVLQAKLEDPLHLDYISDDFKVVIKVAADFKTEIARLIKSGITDIKLDVPEIQDPNINWENIDSSKSNNVKRKMKAISSSSDEENKERINRLIDFQLKKYVFGKITLEQLSNEYPDIWKDVMRIERIFKDKVSEQSLLSTNQEMHLVTYNNLSKEFIEMLEKELKYLTSHTIMLIQQAVVASWLADCHMEFY